jgi:hypothetical protein
MRAPIKHTGHDVVRRKGERGNSIIEFALVSVILIPLIAGLFTVGLALVRSQQILQLNRDIGALYVKNVPMFTDASARLINKLGDGLNMGPNCSSAGMDCNGAQGGEVDYPLPSATGDGVVYMSEIRKVGDFECAQAGFSGASPSEYIADGCTNHGQYVFAQYIPVGNTTLRPSEMGTPVGPFDSERKISNYNLATNTGNRANGFKTTINGPGILYLEPSAYTRVSETFFRLEEISFLINLDLTLNTMDTAGVYARNLY